MRRRRRGIALSVLAVALVAGACGKKGPPLAPLRLVPTAPENVSAGRAGADVQIRFTLPKANANGPGPVDLDRVEIYAVTVAAGAPPPANRDLLTKARLVGTIAVKPPAEEDAPPPPPDAPPDPRPSPGEPVTFSETLTAEKLTPVAAPPVTPAAAAARPAPGAEAAPVEPPAGAAAPAAPGVQAAAPAPVSKHPLRVYALRGLSRSGRPGPPSRVPMPLVVPPPAPTGVAASVTERAVMLDWTPPVAEAGGPALAFNVYRGGEAGAPLNGERLTAPAFEFPGFEFEKEQCFVVRTVALVDNVAIESEKSGPACVLPRDTFPPAPPKGLTAVSAPGVMNLIWDASTEGDLAGYVILRGEVPGDTLRPLTPEPIRETTFKDTTVVAGVRYVYAIVAADRSGNQSAQSARIEETAR